MSVPTESSACLVSFRGTEAPAWVLEGIRSGAIPGVCLFNFNVGSLEQLRELTSSLRRAAADGGQPVPLIGIDQEGGQLAAIADATSLPGNMALAATGSVDYAYQSGRILGLELAALGCNLNFAPVLDLASQGESNVVGLRAFGDDPGLAAELGAAQIRGMQEAGVIACAKHFPGHGNTAADSHLSCPVVERSLAELESLELPPFRRAVEAGVGAVMAAHVSYPALGQGPATFAPGVLRDLLRDRLGFSGLAITDALDMHALDDVPEGERAAKALAAGADLAMLGHLPNQERIVEALTRADLPEARARLASVRAALSTEVPTLADVDWDEHARVAAEMARAAVTLVASPSWRPKPLVSGERIVVISVSAGNLTPAETAGGASQIAEQVAVRCPVTEAVDISYAPSAQQIERAVAAAAGADRVVFASVNAATDPRQQELFRRLLAAGHRPLVVAQRNPLDAEVLAGAEAVACSFGRNTSQTDAAIAVLFGELVASGRMPVALKPSGRALGAERASVA